MSLVAHFFGHGLIAVQACAGGPQATGGDDAPQPALGLLGSGGLVKQVLTGLSHQVLAVTARFQETHQGKGSAGLA